MLAEAIRTSRRSLSIALHLAAGIVFGVIAVELAPRTLESLDAWLAVTGFIAGGAAFIGLDALIERFQSSSADAAESSGQSGRDAGGAWTIYAAVAVDLFGDGLLIGAGSSLSFELALVLALGQVAADIPEGFATIATFRDAGVARTKRILLSASFVVPVLAGAILSYFALRSQPEAYQLTALAFIAGMLLVAAAEEIMKEAHEVYPPSKLFSFAVIFGFGLFAAVASYFG
ncbi:ZIP family metal transporter [Allosphingosinicella sp.]|uniref:ZIP family metal transporter n=1 Tax=Allosphingosinicella sp. TaxID=2823234 RepID=UPI002FC17566